MSINHIDVFRQKIQAGQRCIGTTITFADAAISELIGDAGYDFTWIDMEHCPIDLATALAHVMAARGTQAAPFIRVPAADPVAIKPVLELHPAAIIVPQVQSADEVARAVAACKYPPLGVRGFGPRRGRGFGGIPYPEYLRDADQQIMVLAQIEHIRAAEDLDAILAVPGLDGLCLGFNDLAGSMGLTGQTSHARVIEVATQVVQQTRRTDKYMGVAMGPDPAAIKYWIDQGVQWFAIGSDFTSLYTAAKEILDKVREL